MYVWVGNPPVSKETERGRLTGGRSRRPLNNYAYVNLKKMGRIVEGRWRTQMIKCDRGIQ